MAAKPGTRAGGKRQSSSSAGTAGKRKSTTGARRTAPSGAAAAPAPPSRGGGINLAAPIQGILRTSQSALGQLSGTGRQVQQLANLDMTARTVANVSALVERCNVLLDRLDEEGGVDRLFSLLDRLEPMVDKGAPLLERAGPLLDRTEPLIDDLERVPESVFQIREWVEEVHHHIVPLLHGLGLDLVRLEQIPLASRIRKRIERTNTRRSAGGAREASSRAKS